MALKLSATPFSAVGLLLLMLVVGAVAASEEGGEGDCTGELMSMMPCLDYITDPKATKPLPSCCVELGQVLASQPLCLCYILNGDVSKIIGRPIDKSRALALPGLCKLSTPPTSTCNIVPLPPLTSVPLPPLPPVSGGGGQPAAVPAPLSSAGSSQSPAPLSSDGSSQRWTLSLPLLLPFLVISSVVYVLLF